MTTTIEGIKKLINGKCIKNIDVIKRQSNIYVIIKLFTGLIEIKIDCSPIMPTINKFTISFLTEHNRIIEKTTITNMEK